MSIGIRDFKIERPRAHVMTRRDEDGRVTSVDVIVEMLVTFGRNEPQVYTRQHAFHLRHWEDLDERARAYTLRRLLHEACMRVADESIHIDTLERPFARPDSL